MSCFGIAKYSEHGENAIVQTLFGKKNEEFKYSCNDWSIDNKSGCASQLIKIYCQKYLFV